MSELRRAAARVVLGSLLALGTGVGLVAAGLSEPVAVGAGVGVGLAVGQALFGKLPVSTTGQNE